jgi:S1-C subfamily serine protease
MAATVLAALTPPAASAQLPELVPKLKGSVVAVGTVLPMRSPPFKFSGTGFVVGDGRLVATNAHVLPTAAGDPKEVLAVAVPVAGQAGQIRRAKPLARDDAHDIALLQIEGDPLPPLPLATGALVPEGQEIAVIGYPIGTVLGLFPAVHRGIVAAVSPIVLPQPSAKTLNEKVLSRMGNPFPIYQLDATVYPGNSGSPLIDPRSGAVVGIVNMTFVKGSRESALTNPSGISFAIPVEHLARLLK